MSDVWEVGSARVRDPPTPRRPPTGYARAGRGLALDWPRCTLPAEDLYLSNSVFPLESRDHYFSRKISTGKRESFLFPAHVPLQLCGRLGAPLTRHHNS